MRITLQESMLKSFGIHPASQIRREAFLLARRDMAALILSSLLIWRNLVTRETFAHVSSTTILDEIEQAITSNNAFDSKLGNLRQELVNSLATTVKTIVPVQVFFPEPLPAEVLIETAFRAVRLAAGSGCSPYAALKTEIVKLWLLRNSQGETFDQIWTRREKAYPLGLTTDPRTWPIDQAEVVWVERLQIMTKQGLEDEFKLLIGGKHPGEWPIIESMSHYLTEPLALTAFVDNLSNNYGELDHHFRSSLGRIVMNKASLALLQEPREEVSPEDLATYQRLINQAYRYKAFIRELVIRWSA